MNGVIGRGHKSRNNNQIKKKDLHRTLTSADQRPIPTTTLTQGHAAGKFCYILQFSINGVLLDKPFHTPVKQNIWEQFFVNWHSAANTKATITIVSQNPGTHGNDFGLDRMKFYACESSSLEKELAEVEKGKVIELRNVLFETGSSKIIPSSFVELDELAEYLQKNPSVEIEIAGHTDSVGKDDYNLKLSQDRANAIGRYVIKKGIEAKRLIMKGYGKGVPIDSNETLEGRQKNRRVEFKITKT